MSLMRTRTFLPSRWRRRVGFLAGCAGKPGRQSSVCVCTGDLPGDMGVATSIPVFVVSLVVTLLAAATFARRLDRLGAKHGLPEVWIGLLTALAADGPEISSAL